MAFKGELAAVLRKYAISENSSQRRKIIGKFA
jgi:hypothetical protein